MYAEDDEAVSLPGAVCAAGDARSDQLYLAPKGQLADSGDESDDPRKESDEPTEKENGDEPTEENDSNDYLDSILARNMFMPYSKPPPPPTEYKPETKAEPPKPPGFDHLRFTVVTAIVEVNDQRQVWIHTRTTDELRKLVTGQSFEVGGQGDAARATIGTIGPREVEIISGHDGSQYMVALGDNLQPPLPDDGEDRSAGSM